MSRTTPVGVGGLALRAWLDKHDLTIPQFAERLGVSRVQIQRLVSGTRGIKRVNSALVALIERDTGGEVPRSVWSVATTLPAEDAS